MGGGEGGFLGAMSRSVALGGQSALLLRVLLAGLAKRTAGGGEGFQGRVAVGWWITRCVVGWWVVRVRGGSGAGTWCLLMGGAGQEDSGRGVAWGRV